MAVRCFYVDESWDQERFCLTAISIRHSDWHDCTALIQEHRKHLQKDFEMYTRKEIHARDLVSGRGRVGTKVINKGACLEHEGVKTEVFED